jgi:hypothetical protein
MPNDLNKNLPEFEPQPMVGWFDISQLAKTGIKSVISGVFGTFADKRETLGALNKETYFDYSSNPELWVDYMSDTGDGFDSTYSMAHLLAQNELKVEGIPNALPASKIVILGGDQVYPSATRSDYKNRFEGPFKTAFAKNKGIEEHDMFVVPGNHDWYDGLNNFSKLFLQNRTIGNLKTCQNRSYFAIKVSENLWIWAIDIQLDADIDKPQMDYFGTFVSSKMNEGDQVILCTAEPSWVYSNSVKDNTSYHNLKFFENYFIVNFKEDPSRKKFKLIANLTGDLHHYSHYCVNDPKQPDADKFHKITAGGGGAFLHPTHNLPDKLTGLREGDDFELQKVFPSKADSKKLVWKNLLFLKYNWSFGLFLAGIFVLFDWLLNIYSHLIVFNNKTNLDLITQMKITGFTHFWEISVLFTKVISKCPQSLILLLVLIIGLLKFCDTKSSKSKFIWILGLAHGLIQSVWMFVSFWLFSFVNHLILAPSYGSFLENTTQLSILTLFEVFLFAGPIINLIMGFYLIIANRFFKIHDNEAFSAIKIENWKCFLRMHFTKEELTIYPIGVREISKWQWNPSTQTFFTTKLPGTELIESPIKISLK